MSRKQKRGVLIAAAVGLLAVSGLLFLAAIRDNIVFFHTPTELLAGKAISGSHVRLGGLVEKGSVQRDADGLDVKFRVTDGRQSLLVLYSGILPDLFREGQGVVAEGRLTAGERFEATTILAKHDETYMPREVAAALEGYDPTRADK